MASFWKEGGGVRMNEGRAFVAAAVPGRLKAFDYVELMKPELTGLSVLTALCGFFLAANEFHIADFLWMGLGTLLVGGGAGTLNQYAERNFDALMRRTERRPLPAGRLSTTEVLLFGISLSIGGLGLLAVATNLLTVFLGAATLISYLFFYTPLKRRTPWSTLVGGIPGALPPVMGWSAATNEIGTGAYVLFAILFFWQVPHFLSLAWIYRKDYLRAGYRTLCVVDTDGRRTGRHILVSLIALSIVSVGTSFVGITGLFYLGGSLLLGLAFFAYGILFQQSTGGLPANLARKNFYSRQLFFASLIYLPVLMILMTVDKL